MVIKITKDSNFCGKTLLSYLHSLSFSSKMIKFLKYRENGLCVNSEKVTVRYILKEGDILEIATDDNESSSSAEPKNIEIDIVYEDENFIVVNKPPYMPTHPSHNHHDDTLANALAYYFKERGIPFVFRPINRLDRNTSGLVLIAKNKISAGKLSEFMQKRKIQKSYIAILKGELPYPAETTEYCGMTLGIINKYIRRAQESIIFREICKDSDKGAESAVTLYKIIKKNSLCTVVMAFPLTGRTHQLRVHFASLGHPIISDDLYGYKDSNIDRHALHANSLSFPKINPSDKENYNFSADLPEDMKNVIDHYFK